MTTERLRGAVRRIMRRAGLTGGGLRLGWVKNGKRPRIHDLRHSFACRVLFKWRFRKAGREDRIDWLSHYLGHERVSDTYWYLSATPELFAAAVSRFKPPT